MILAAAFLVGVTLFPWALAAATVALEPRVILACEGAGCRVCRSDALHLPVD
jgi:hypothetical protein